MTSSTEREKADRALLGREGRDPVKGDILWFGGMRLYYSVATFSRPFVTAIRNEAGRPPESTVLIPLVLWFDMVKYCDRVTPGGW